MSNDNLTVRDALTQPGGAFQIAYKGYMVMAPTNDVHKGIKLLRETEDRAEVMHSVQAAIDEILPRMESGAATQQEAINCCQDITIWFANEVIEGRATLEQKNLAFIKPPKQEVSDA